MNPFLPIALALHRVSMWLNPPIAALNVIGFWLSGWWLNLTMADRLFLLRHLLSRDFETRRMTPTPAQIAILAVLSETEARTTTGVVKRLGRLNASPVRRHVYADLTEIVAAGWASAVIVGIHNHALWTRTAAGTEVLSGDGIPLTDVQVTALAEQSRATRAALTRRKRPEPDEPVAGEPEPRPRKPLLEGAEV